MRRDPKVEVSHHAACVHSGAEKKKETSSQRSLMEEIQERQESPHPKDASSAPSSPHPPLTPQTPSNPQTPQRPDSSRGHSASKRFHSEISLFLLTSLSVCALTLPPNNHCLPHLSITSSGRAAGVTPLSLQRLGPPGDSLSFQRPPGGPGVSRGLLGLWIWPGDPLRSLRFMSFLS